MVFRAFSQDAPLELSLETRDEGARVIETIEPSRQPLGESETREGITEFAYAQLGRNPRGLIYITDSNNRVLERLRCREYDQSILHQESQEKWSFLAWSLLLLCAVCFLATVALGLGWGGVALCVLIALLHLTIVLVPLANEMESAVVCTMLLLTILCLVLPIRALREAQTRTRLLESAAPSGLPPTGSTPAVPASEE